MRSENELRALLVLLGDEEERVASVAWDQLSMARDAAVPLLEEATQSPEPLLRGRARLLLEELRRGSSEEEWNRFAGQPDSQLDLEQGCLLLSRMGGSADVRSIPGFLDAIAGMVRAHMVSVGGLQALSEVLFDNLGFRGGDFEDPRSHYLSTVLERRTGIPISLATVYVLVGRRLGLPVCGVAMPGHYLARMERPEGPVFIDCYNRGRQYRFESLVDLLTSKGLRFSDDFLEPAPDRFTLFRMLNNLENLYVHRDEERTAGDVRRWRDALGVKR